MLRIIFYKDTKQSQVRHGLAKKSLEAVNRWAERLYRVSPQALRHDVAVWLTRIDLGGPSGYAPVAGVCEPSRSCTLNRDEGLTSSFIIAHEMAHVLGLSHDGDPVAANDCEDEGYQGSVMAPLVAATFSRFHWSKCSKTEYHTKAHDWSCLLNKPQWKNATTVLSTIKYQYSLDDQCRMEFGEGYGLCSSFGATDPCTHLWCSNSSSPHHCKTKKGPPLEGTTCGEQKWCRHGFCVAVSQETEDTDGESPVRHNPQDGGWSTWSQWGPCSRTCGTGVAFRTRACDHPPPAWGGRRCRGKREEWKVCGVEECPLPRIDIRAQQCSFITRIVNLDLRRSALSWLPYEPKRRKKKCRISCYSHATNEVYIGREYVVDGTPCSYDQPNDICVQGKCVAMGCDKVVASMAQEDECGVCGGDGATCINNQFDYHEVPPTEYSLVATLPAGARNIMIKEEAPTMNFLALTDNSSSFFLNGGRSQEPSKSFISEGAKFLYSSRGEREVLQARGPLLRPVSIMIHGTRAQESVRVTTTFLTQLKQEHYQWEVGPFTACSVTCGGGEQHQTLVCRDRRTDKQVFHSSCRHLPRPSLNTTTCNSFGCKAKWVTGPWEHCSTTCGPHGVQERTVSCVTLPEADGTNRTTGIVDPLRCSTDPMPEAQRECLRDPCPAHWSPSGWGECSSSCGEGVETRLWECVGGGGNEVTYNCGPQPRQVRVCIKAPCPPAPCLRDSSAFCQLPVLHRYCQVPKYRELCCHTCANIVY
ncbi:A disintegrin and metalloproteinase with thrombospondin motifs 3-like [Homarus americanus]|uniref:A disintegrin and metalloproteinase with thrombospondin motifs 3-like n=1 Tax=Homarus americanus TaxID=6706 RepID=UPI001C47A601|nr:A disintegrin and metalloproteinase with thrombospondin motifs 3-like [Homarus americanus]